MRAFFVCGVYLWHTEGCTSTNGALMDAVLKSAAGMTRPWINARDDNMELEEFWKGKAGKASGGSSRATQTRNLHLQQEECEWTRHWTMWSVRRQRSEVGQSKRQKSPIRSHNMELLGFSGEGRSAQTECVVRTNGKQMMSRPRAASNKVKSRSMAARQDAQLSDLMNYNARCRRSTNLTERCKG